MISRMNSPKLSCFLMIFDDFWWCSSKNTDFQLKIKNMKITGIQPMFKRVKSQIPDGYIFNKRWIIDQNIPREKKIFLVDTICNSKILNRITVMNGSSWQGNLFSAKYIFRIGVTWLHFTCHHLEKHWNQGSTDRNRYVSKTEPGPIEIIRIVQQKSKIGPNQDKF